MILGRREIIGIWIVFTTLCHPQFLKVRLNGRMEMILIEINKQQYTTISVTVLLSWGYSKLCWNYLIQKRFTQIPISDQSSCSAWLLLYLWPFVVFCSCGQIISPPTPKVKCQDRSCLSCRNPLSLYSEISPSHIQIVFFTTILILCLHLFHCTIIKGSCRPLYKQADLNTPNIIPLVVQVKSGIIRDY